MTSFSGEYTNGFVSATGEPIFNGLLHDGIPVTIFNITVQLGQQ